MIVLDLGVLEKWNLVTSYSLEQVFELGQLQLFDDCNYLTHALELTFENFVLRYSHRGPESPKWPAMKELEKELSRPDFLSRFCSGSRSGRERFLLALPGQRRSEVPRHRLEALGLPFDLTEVAGRAATEPAEGASPAPVAGP